MPTGLVILHGEHVVFIRNVHVHFTREHISSQADIHVGKPGVDSIEDGLSVRQCFDVDFVSFGALVFGGFVADNELVHDVDFSVALLIVDWVAHEVVLTLDTLFNIKSFVISLISVLVCHAIMRHLK